MTVYANAVGRIVTEITGLTPGANTFEVVRVDAGYDLRWFSTSVSEPSGESIAASALPAAKQAAKQAASTEAVRRMSLVNELFDSADAYLAFEAVFTTLIAAVPTLTAAAINNNLQDPLASIKAIRDAYMSMRTEINALTTVEDCESYITGIAADTASSPRTINWP